MNHVNHGALKALLKCLCFSVCCLFREGGVGALTRQLSLKGEREAYLGYQKPFCYRLAAEQHQQEPSRRNNYKHESMHHLRHIRTVPTK